MANLDFKKDIKMGNDGENVVLSYLESVGGKLINKNHDNKYDLLIEYKNKEISYEIKTDFFCSPGSDSGNIFIETECRGKKSGIEVTKADWFVTYFIFHGEVWYIKTDELKNLIQENNFKIGIGGDPGSNSTGYLIPREEFKSFFKVKKAPKVSYLKKK